MALSKLPFSVPLLLLDVVGALSIGAGAMLQVGLFESLPPESADWGWPLMVGGFLLTLPFAIDMLRRARLRSAAQAGAAAAAEPERAQSTVRRG